MTSALEDLAARVASPHLEKLYKEFPARGHLFQRFDGRDRMAISTRRYNSEAILSVLDVSL